MPSVMQRCKSSGYNTYQKSFEKIRNEMKA